MSGVGSTVEDMDESKIYDLLVAIHEETAEQAVVLRSIDSRLVEVINGLATVADGVIS
jgi:hypothetical protein